MINLTKNLFALWTRLFKQWLTQKFDSISIDLTPVAKQSTLISGVQNILTSVNPKATSQEVRDAAASIIAALRNIDFSVVENKIDALDEKITPYLYDECSVEEVEHMFTSITEDGYIIVPSGIINPDGTIHTNTFMSITGLAPVLKEDEDTVAPIIDENSRIILPAHALSSDGTMSMRLFRQLTGLKLV